MSALDDARLLIARRSHRKVAIRNLTEVAQTLLVTRANETMKKVFGTELDEDVVVLIAEAEERVQHAITRLTQHNDEEEMG